MNEIAVLSGKGGTGKTCLSAAFATLCSNVVVADCDVDAANLYLILNPENSTQETFVSGQKARINNNKCTNCGVCISYCRFDAIRYNKGKVEILETSCDGCMLCMRVCPEHAISMALNDKSKWYSGAFRNGNMVHARLEPGEENSGKLVSVVRKAARELAKENGADTVIIDGPPGTGCPAISSLIGTRKAIIVAEPTGSGFHDMKRIIELTGNFGIKTYVVINRYDLNPKITEKIAGWCNENDVPLAGRIAFDPEMVEAMLQCKSIVEFNPGSDVSREIITIWNKIEKDEQTTNY